MAILVDYSNISIASLVKSLHSKNDETISPQTLLGKIRLINTKFRAEYGELILCVDKGSWRTEAFPLYKARRKAHRAAMDKQAEIDRAEGNEIDDMTVILKVAGEVRDAFDQYGPYRIIAVSGAEGDDCMAVLAQRLPGRHIIITTDKDLSQLKSPNIDIWHPINKEFVDNGKDFAKHLVVCGDPGDDVPNILSDEDVFITPGKKQRQMSKGRYTKIMEAVYPEEGISRLSVNGISNEDILKRYQQNFKIIDLRLSNIPERIVGGIMASYESQEDRSTKGFMNLMITLRCSGFMSRASDFMPERKPKSKFDLC